LFTWLAKRTFLDEHWGQSGVRTGETGVSIERYKKGSTVGTPAESVRFLTQQWGSVNTVQF
jgi:hypothetical protein